MADIGDLITDIVSDKLTEAMESDRTPKLVKSCFMGFFIFACLIFGIGVVAMSEFSFATVIAILVCGGFIFLAVRYIVNLYKKKPAAEKTPQENTASDDSTAGNGQHQ